VTEKRFLPERVFGERSGREPNSDMNQNREKGCIPKPNLDKCGESGESNDEKSSEKKDENQNSDR